jgi:hypothetical protein
MALTDIELMEFLHEVEGVLNRIERASTHYEVLGINPRSGKDEIQHAYRQAIILLNPNDVKYLRLNLVERVRQAYRKASEAHSVLSNYGKKVEYDNRLVHRLPTPLHPLRTLQKTAPSPPQQGALANDGHKSPPPDGPIGQSGQSLRKTAPQVTKERRQFRRYKLSIPVHVTGYSSRSERRSEIGTTFDVSIAGAGLKLSTPVQVGNIIYLKLPMPTKLRRHGYAEPSYNVYSMVRRVIPTADGGYLVGLTFIGENPPPGYLEKPWAIFKH